MNDTRNSDPVPDFTTGDDARKPAKSGLPRGEHDADRAAEAQRVNNAGPDYPLELLEGRCPLDGLPEGNCVHFPGPQLVTGPDGQARDSGDLAADEAGNTDVRKNAAEEKTAAEKPGKEPRRR